MAWPATIHRAPGRLGTERGKLREFGVAIPQQFRRDPLNLLQIRRAHRRGSVDIDVAGYVLDLGYVPGPRAGHMLTALRRRRDGVHPRVTSPLAPSICVRSPPTHTPLTACPPGVPGTGAAAGGTAAGGTAAGVVAGGVVAGGAPDGAPDRGAAGTCRLPTSFAWVRRPMTTAFTTACEGSAAGAGAGAAGAGAAGAGAGCAGDRRLGPPQLWMRSSRSVCSYTRSWASWSRDFLDDFLSLAEL